MRNIILSGTLATIGVATALTASCGDPAVSCGPGTVLNEETQQCRPITSPDFNVIVDDFNIGDFAFTNTDVPEQMQPGFPDDRTFTITNTGEEDQTVTLVRISLVPVDENIDELRDAIDDVGSEVGCETDADCTTSTRCDEVELVCKLDVRVIGAAIIENLAAGEERLINYQLALPANFEDTGVYGLMFSVNEVALVKDEETGEYYEDPEHPLGTEDPFARAAALYAPATMLVGIPDKPNLRVLFADVDNAAFTAEAGDTPIMTVSGRISAQGRNVVAPVHTKFELLMPGHVVQVAGQDLGEQYFIDRDLDYSAAPADTTYVYDENRSFDLLIATGAGERALQSDFLAACVNDECTEQVTVQNDLGRDGTWALHLSQDDLRTLSQTSALASLNPDLDANLEMVGTIRMTVSTDEDEYEVNGSPLLSDNVEEFDVVFMAPEAGRDADLDNDTDLPPESGSGQAEMVPGPGPYPDVDNLSPLWTWSVGNEWVGASAQIKNYTSKRRQFGAVVAQDVVSDNFVRLNAIKNHFDVVVLAGSFDWGSRRTMTQNRASGRLALFGTTYLDINFQPGIQCQTEDNFETCMVLAAEFRPRKNDGSPVKNPRQKKKFYVNWERSKKWYFAVGPLPFEIEVGVAAGLGMRATVAFVQDRSQNDADGSAITTGLQVTLGPVADAGGSAFGGLTLGLLRGGIKGSITFASVEFQPAVLVGVTQDMNEAGNCWNYNGGEVRFEGPLTLTVLSGDIKVVVEGGVCGCLPWLGCACAWGEIFSFTIVTIPPAWSKTWYIWQNTYNFAAGPGMCPSAPPPAGETWNSPIGCKDPWGADAYCNNANGTGAYSKFFARSSGCGTLVINGEVENWYDYVNVRDANNNLLMRESGAFNNRTVNYCAPGATVSVQSDYMVVKKGISVKAQ